MNSARSSPEERVPRLHAVLLAIIMAVGLARGLFWASVTLVFNPIDEAAHFAYVESMATTLRPPVVGRDHLSPDVLDLAKRTRTAEWRSAPIAADPNDPRWGLVRESYEGVQGPTYYALMAIAFKIAHPFGVLTALYAVRLASLLLALTAVPITYMLARELFPLRREVWLAAPALLVVLQGFNGNLSSVSNDALVVPLAGATLLVVALSRRLGLTIRNALATGLLLGLGLCTKSQMVALFPMVAAAAVGIAVVRREPWVRLLKWGTVAAVTSIVTAVPWLIWNLAKYRALSASAEVDKITGPLQPHYPRSIEGVRQHLVSGSNSFWDYQLVAKTLGRYMWAMTIPALVLLLAAVIISVVRHRTREAVTLSWLASAWFVTFAMMLVVIYGVFDGRSSVVGRHLYPSLVAVVVAVAASTFIVAGKWLGWAVLLVLANFAFTFEQPLVDSRIDHDYTEGIVGNLTPVVDQSWGEGLVEALSVEVSPPCPAHKLAFAFSGLAPATLPVLTSSRSLVAQRSGEQGSAAQRLTVYDLPSPVTQRFTVVMGGEAISASSDDRDPNLVLTGQPGDPVARVFCPVHDPKTARFVQLFRPDHPSFLRYGYLSLWPTAWAWLARVLPVAFGACYLRQRRRGGSSDVVQPAEVG